MGKPQGTRGTEYEDRYSPVGVVAVHCRLDPDRTRERSSGNSRLAMHICAFDIQLLGKTDTAVRSWHTRIHGQQGHLALVIFLRVRSGASLRHLTIQIILHIQTINDSTFRGRLIQTYDGLNPSGRSQVTVSGSAQTKTLCETTHFVRILEQHIATVRTVTDEVDDGPDDTPSVRQADVQLTSKVEGPEVLNPEDGVTVGIVWPHSRHVAEGAKRRVESE
jgi:hypothetical protein